MQSKGNPNNGDIYLAGKAGHDDGGDDRSCNILTQRDDAREAHESASTCMKVRKLGHGDEFGMDLIGTDDREGNGTWRALRCRRGH